MVICIIYSLQYIKQAFHKILMLPVTILYVKKNLENEDPVGSESYVRSNQIPFCLSTYMFDSPN